LIGGFDRLPECLSHARYRQISGIFVLRDEMPGAYRAEGDLAVNDSLRPPGGVPNRVARTA
jgi:hypothetical protein